MEAIRPILLSGRDVATAAPSLGEIISIVEETYRMDFQGLTEAPAKLGVYPDRPQSFLHAMPAWVAGTRALGLKWVSLFPGNVDRGLPDSSGVIVLNDPDSGLPIAIMEGMWITYARTSACAAVAAKYLARGEPRRLGLVGCGELGRWSLRAISTVFPSIEEVFVSSKRAETRASFCAGMAREGDWRLEPVDATCQAVEGMDIVVSSVPKLNSFPINGNEWSPGTLLIPLDVTGSWDDGIYSRADRLICDSPENLRQALARYRPGLTLDWQRTTLLQQVVTGQALGRRALDERIMAFVTGIASLDMTVAQAIFKRAARAGIGLRFDMT